MRVYRQRIMDAVYYQRIPEHKSSTLQRVIQCELYEIRYFTPIIRFRDCDMEVWLKSTGDPRNEIRSSCPE